MSAKAAIHFSPCLSLKWITVFATKTGFALLGDN